MAHKLGYNRRRFLQGAAAAAAFTVVPRHVLGQGDQPAANDRIRIAAVGAGGRAGADIKGVGSEDIVAICDVDERQGGKIYEQFPAAKRYRDFRKMLDEVDKRIDAVVVGTPDHTHAVACMDAIRRRKHVYCEKPLAHSVWEVRRVMQAAREHQVITQLGNQGHSSSSIRSFCEWIWDGAIGKVKEVHAFCDAFKNVYSQIDKLPEAAKKEEIPSQLDWDLWLGPVPRRPYHSFYVPWNWRGWLAFGTGAIGDWVCHVVDPVFWALDLGAPVSVEAEVEGYDPALLGETYPTGTKVTFQFAAKGDRGPVTLYWYDGNWRPPRPAELEEGRNPPGTGAIVVGDQGTIMHGSHGAGGVRLIPESKMQEYERPDESIPRVKGHHQDWLDAIRENRPAGSNFDYGGPLTQIALLGVIAIKMPGTLLEWDDQAMQFTNCEKANRYLRPEFRDGWSL